MEKERKDANAGHLGKTDTGKAQAVILTDSQEYAYTQLKAFLDSKDERVFILKGYAGTGKTTLIRLITTFLKEQKRPYSLLASTGRAAKIASDVSGMVAKTIHSHLYQFSKLDQDLDELEKLSQKPFADKSGQLKMVFEIRASEHVDSAVYIIDEASMISNVRDERGSFADFGSGQLLNDLLNHNPKGKYIFIGDPCQLPPGNMSFSPALSRSFIEKEFKLKARSVELTQIMRQKKEAGITIAAAALRKMHQNPEKTKWVHLPLKNKTDIILYDNHPSLINAYASTIRNENYSRSTMICQTNKHCLELNQNIRRQLGKKEGTVEEGDLLMITQNNYLVPLVNGDQVIISALGNFVYRSGIIFREAVVKPLHKNEKYSVMLMEDLLYSISANINQRQQVSLLIDFKNRMKELGVYQKDAAFKENMLNDPYLNALRAKFGYANTCHKSQGGEWEEVYLYLDNKIQGYQRPAVYQWWYTAVTRAKNKLHAVNDWYVK